LKWRTSQRYNVHIYIYIYVYVTLKDPSSFSWRLKLLCSHCRRESQKHVYISENEKVEQLTGHGTTNLNYKCWECERKSQVDVLGSTYQPWTATAAAKNDGYVPMIQFDCRGVEIVSWDPLHHEQSGIVAYAGTDESDEDGMEFEVDFSEGEWSDYDADNDRAIGIYGVHCRVNKVK
jgi:hypothetical protein